MANGIEITTAMLEKIMPMCKNVKDRATYAALITRYAKDFKINTRLRMAHYLAQIAYESGSLHYTKEIATGEAYEGRADLGNTNKGDGVRYKGRGLIQLTGKSNYRMYAKFCGVDVVARPELLEQPVGAVRSSMWYWQTHGLNEWADKDNIIKITRIVNGGTNGLVGREDFLTRAKKVLGV